MPKNSPDNIFSVKKIHTDTPDIEEVNESLDSIYNESGQEKANIAKLVKSEGRGFLFYINWSIILLLIGYGIFYSYTELADRFFAGEEGEFTLELEMQNASASGEEFSFDIVYTNGLAVRAREIELRLQFPDTFVVNNTVPESSDEDNRFWKIASVAPGKSERVTVTGTVFGEIGSNHIFQTFISFEPENFSSRFEEQASSVLQIASGNVISKKTFPAQAIAGELLTYEVELFASESLEEDTIVRVTPKLPDSFELAEEGTTEFVENTSYWEVSGLFNEDEAPPGEGNAPKITFKGIFTDDRSLEEVITLEYTVKGADDNYYLEKKDDFTTKIIEGEFIINLILNGESEERAVNVGEVLTYSLSYRNQSETDAKNVSLSIEFPIGFMDYDTLSVEPLGKRDGDTLTWTSEEIAHLESLPSGDSGEIDIVITMKESLPSDSAAEFVNVAVAAISGFGDLETELSVKSNEVKSLINSDLSWYASARYYNDDDIAIGSGPMPPQVGRTTTLHIIWRLDSSSHEINALEVSGKLPAIVEWTGKTITDAGNLSYNASSREVTWNIDELTKGTGVVEADFEVSITPTFDELNKIILLMQGAKLTALDKDTEGEIDLSGKALTTDLEDDPVLSGRGLVEN